MEMKKVLNAFSLGLSQAGSQTKVKFQGDKVCVYDGEIILPSWLLSAGIEDVELALGFSTNAISHQLFPDTEAQDKNSQPVNALAQIIWAVIDDARAEGSMMADRHGTKAFLEPANKKLAQEAMENEGSNLHVLTVLVASKSVLYPSLEDGFSTVKERYIKQYSEELFDGICTVLVSEISTSEKTEAIMNLIAEAEPPESENEESEADQPENPGDSQPTEDSETSQDEQSPDGPGNEDSEASNEQPEPEAQPSNGGSDDGETGPAEESEADQPENPGDSQPTEDSESSQDEQSPDGPGNEDSEASNEQSEPEAQLSEGGGEEGNLEPDEDDGTDHSDSGEKTKAAYTLGDLLLNTFQSREDEAGTDMNNIRVELLNPTSVRVKIDKKFYDLSEQLAESVSRKSGLAIKGKGHALRTACLPVASSGMNPFGAKKLVTGESAHFVIAADMSGSMDKLAEKSLTTMLSFASELKSKGDTWVDVITYWRNYEWLRNEMGVITEPKPLEAVIGIVNNLDRFPDIEPDGLTPTAEAITFAAQMLASSPYERRGIIVITDGHPDEPHLNLCQNLEKNGIEVYGLGLTEAGVEAVKVNFTHYINASDNNLATALMAATA